MCVKAAVYVCVCVWGGGGVHKLLCHLSKEGGGEKKSSDGA